MTFDPRLVSATCLIMAEGTVGEVQSLQELFKEGWEAQKSIEKDEFSSNSEEFKVCSYMHVTLWYS